MPTLAYVELLAAAMTMTQMTVRLLLPPVAFAQAKLSGNHAQALVV